jgi:oxygen-independent coproporphyrinogen III oxidase
VQDNNPVVQKAINRIQPMEHVKAVTDIAREIGYQSVNYDLIYGLPFQTLTRIQKTLQECIELAPDRFAFYSYAHVPWTSRGQRLFDENDLPTAGQKMSFYQEGVKIFQAANYQHIGMDHFVLPSDDLFGAWKSGTLYRNFMGYTSQHTNLQLGLGVSAISDTSHVFVQNSKSLLEYYRLVGNHELPVNKGYFLNHQDELFKKYILDISCRGRTYFQDEYREDLELFSFPLLKDLERDGLVELKKHYVEVTLLGKNFIRNICRAFDQHFLRKNISDTPGTYSKAI